MKLTSKKIKEIAVGYIDAVETENGIEFNRFTKSQAKKFGVPNRYFGGDPFFDGYFERNCRTTSGVKLDFYTDAKSVTVRIKQNDRMNDVWLMQCDTYVDGKMKAVCDADKDFTVQIGKRKLKHRVTVYLPTFNFPVIAGVELEEATYCEPTGKGIDVLCYGDSITHGASPTHASAAWVNVMSRITGYRVLNQANSGYIFDASVLEKVCDPKIICIAYGINDQGRKTRPEFEKDARDFVLKVKELYPKAKIFGITPIWTEWEKEKENRPFTNESRAILKKVYEECGAVPVDGLKLMPNDLKCLSDAVHPNEYGHTFYGRRMAKVLALCRSK